MRRTHVSPHREPIAVEERVQTTDPAMKPRGFWYEVNGDWRRWCRGEMPDWVAGKHLHRVSLGAERMLNIRRVDEIDAFVEAYHVSEFVSGQWYSGDIDRGIRWDRVAERWDGIEIAPYQWQRRLDGPIWYYGWDCASGVIWRPAGVQVEWSRRLQALAAEKMQEALADG